jgi:hypothetical protein
MTRFHLPPFKAIGDWTLSVKVQMYHPPLPLPLPLQLWANAISLLAFLSGIVYKGEINGSINGFLNGFVSGLRPITSI